jgi:predicted nucleic acid-binding protein
LSFVLDTCVVSELTRPAVDPRVLQWFAGQPPEALFLSVLTVGEVEKGIARLAQGPKRRRLTAWLAALRTTYADRLLAIDEAVAATWGRLAARAEQDGSRIGVVDGLISATALHHGYTVVTRNVADFAPSCVALLNPWEP